MVDWLDGSKDGQGLLQCEVAMLFFSELIPAG